MNETTAVGQKAKISIEQIMGDLRDIRNAGIQRLLQDNEELMTFMEKHFNTIAISAVKTEFLKRDLKSLVLEPLDLAFYSSLITQIRSTGDQSSSKDHPLFLAELLMKFEKYGFVKG